MVVVCTYLSMQTIVGWIIIRKVSGDSLALM